MSRHRIGSAVALIALLLAGLGSASPASAGGSPPATSRNAFRTVATPVITQSVFTTDIYYQINFNRPAQTFRFALQASGGSQLTISTLDCCIVGDHWGVTVVRNNVARSKCGSGSTDRYSGFVRQSISSGRATAIVFYCSGVDKFSAGMTLHLHYDGNLSSRLVN